MDRDGDTPHTHIHYWHTQPLPHFIFFPIGCFLSSMHCQWWTSCIKEKNTGIWWQHITVLLVRFNAQILSLDWIRLDKLNKPQKQYYITSAFPTLEMPMWNRSSITCFSGLPIWHWTMRCRLQSPPFVFIPPSSSTQCTYILFLYFIFLVFSDAR